MRKIPGWDEWFLDMCDLVKTKSKDRSTQVGAVVVGEGHTVLSVGYNGFPRGVDDAPSWRHERPAKYLYTAHAEANAVYAAARNGGCLKGAKLYCSTPHICAGCALAIIQSGIVAVVAKDLRMVFGGSDWETSCQAAQTMFSEAGVEVVKLRSTYASCKLVID